MDKQVQMWFQWVMQRKIKQVRTLFHWERPTWQLERYRKGEIKQVLTLFH